MNERFAADLKSICSMMGTTLVVPKIRIRLKHFEFSKKGVEVLYLNSMLEAVKVLHDILEGCKTDPTKAVKTVIFETMVSRRTEDTDKITVDPDGSNWRAIASWKVEVITKVTENTF